MKDVLHNFGKFYSRVMMNFIGIFIFIGIMCVVFGEHGWLPNEDIYAISGFVYRFVLPVLIAYASGNQMKWRERKEKQRELYAGGTIAVMATAGLLMADTRIGILGAMLIGPCSGILWNTILEPFIKRVNTGIEMLVRNIIVAGVGSILAIGSYYILSPVIGQLNQLLMGALTYLINHRLLFLLSVIIEPAKVFFLNNSIHHGLLLPLGVQQAELSGSSILFLLETNPGPGLGILLALYWKQREKRKEYAADMFAECIGGIHEVYFPEVLSNIRLVLPLIAGGIAGTLCFLIFHAGAASAISPGSVITLFLVCDKSNLPAVLLGVVISTLVSMLLAMHILSMQKRRRSRRKQRQREQTREQITQENNAECVTNSWKGAEKMIERIGFVCDAGVGSSSMGAALFRRILLDMQITDIQVNAYAMDQVPDDLDLVICQKNFKDVLLSEQSFENICTISSLLNREELAAIAEKIQRKEVDL